MDKKVRKLDKNAHVANWGDLKLGNKDQHFKIYQNKQSIQFRMLKKTSLFKDVIKKTRTDQKSNERLYNSKTTKDGSKLVII